MNNETIKRAALAAGWEFPNQPDPHYIRFKKGDALLDIWSTGTTRFIPEPWAKPVYTRDNTEESIIKLLLD